MDLMAANSFRWMKFPLSRSPGEEEAWFALYMASTWAGDVYWS